MVTWERECSERLALPGSTKLPLEVVGHEPVTMVVYAFLACSSTQTLAWSRLRVVFSWVLYFARNSLKGGWVLKVYTGIILMTDGGIKTELGEK